MVKLSVIIPVYNVEKYLNQCVDSILACPNPDYEVILVDDGATDDSGRLCDTYAYRDNVTVIHQENGGVSCAKNSGMRVAKGEYVIFVDGDDFVYPEPFGEAIEFLSVNTADIVVAVKDFLIGDRKREYNISLATGEVSPKYRLMDAFFDEEICLWGPNSNFFRRDFLSKNGCMFDETLRMAEDLELFFRAFDTADTVMLFNKKISCYREVREGSIMFSVSVSKFYDLVASYTKTMKMLADSGRQNSYKKLFAFMSEYVLYNVRYLIDGLENSSEYYDILRKNIHVLDHIGNKKQKLIVKLMKAVGIERAMRILNALNLGRGRRK